MKSGSQVRGRSPHHRQHTPSIAAAHTYAIDRETAREWDLRRYGFHGTSYTYVLGKTAELLGKPQSEVSAIICHIGSGASMAVCTVTSVVFCHY